MGHPLQARVHDEHRCAPLPAPPRPRWEAKGYRPDEYSRWLKGAWRPIDELWAELGVDPTRPEPAAIDLEDWLFDCDATPERRQAERTFVHGHLLAPGDVMHTPSPTSGIEHPGNAGILPASVGREHATVSARCARPPYDRIPIPRAAIPEGIILSREADAWIRETEIEDVALPLYEGRMIGPFDFSQKGWVSGKGRSAVWRDIPWEQKQIEPQYLMAEEDYRRGVPEPDAPKLAHMNIASATNERTAIGAYVQRMPVGHSAGVFFSRTPADVAALTAVWNSLSFDFVTRLRVVGLHLDYHVMEQNPVPLRSPQFETLIPIGTSLTLTSPRDSPSRIRLAGPVPGAPEAQEPHAPHDLPALDSRQQPMRLFRPPDAADTGASPGAQPRSLALREHERIRRKAIVDAVVAALYGLETADFRTLLADCDHPVSTTASRKTSELRAKGFWRVDKDKPPELRHTVLAQIAFADLERHIAAANGNREAGIRSFMAQNDGEGWLLPDTLRLADYDLGHDDRAREHQPVASALGPRFHDWQLAQPPEEAWRETHLHARNLLGEHAYRRLLAEIEERSAKPASATATRPLSEVAEPRHSHDDWLERTADDRKPRKPPAANQPDLFD